MVALMAVVMAACAKAGSEEVNVLLDEYEVFMQEYTEVAKQIKSGDISQLDKFTEMTEQMEEKHNVFSEKAQSGEMSLEQATRFEEISKKFADEIQ